MTEWQIALVVGGVFAGAIVWGGTVAGCLMWLLNQFRETRHSAQSSISQVSQIWAERADELEGRIRALEVWAAKNKGTTP